MAFLGGLALLGSAGEAYQSSKAKQYALDQAETDQQASIALGKGMQGLAQLQQLSTGGGPTPGGGQPPPGMPPPGAGPPGMSGGGATMPQPRPPVQFGPPGGGGGGPPPAPMGGLPGSPGGGMPPSGGPPPAMPPPGGGGAPGQPNMTPGMMDLPTLAAVIQRANPGIKPEVFAQALQQGAKLLSPFAQNQLREMMMHLQQQRLQQGEERIQQGDERLRQGQEKIDTQAQQFETRSQQRDRELGLKVQALEEKQTEFKIREARFNAQNNIKNNMQLQKLEIERKRLESTLSKDTLAQYRAIIDAQHKIVSEQIAAAAAGLSVKERKELLGEEDKRYQDEIKGIRGLLGRSTPGGGTSETPQPKSQERAPSGSATFSDRFGAAPSSGAATFGDRFGAATGVPVPKEHAGDPDGTVYDGSNGKQYKKQGDMMVPAGQ